MPSEMSLITAADYSDPAISESYNRIWDGTDEVDWLVLKYGATNPKSIELIQSNQGSSKKAEELIRFCKCLIPTLRLDTSDLSYMP